MLAALRVDVSAAAMTTTTTDRRTPTRDATIDALPSRWAAAVARLFLVSAAAEQFRITVCTMRELIFQRILETYKG